MSETQNIYSPCGVDELFKWLVKRTETDAKTQGELWDVYKMDQIEKYRDKLKTEMENKGKN